MAVLTTCGVQSIKITIYPVNPSWTEESDIEEEFRVRDLKIKEKTNKIKLWGFLFNLANALLLALYKDWLG